MSSTATVQLTHVYRSYGAGPNRVEAVRDVDLSVADGEIVVLTGPSGSGKSTILHIAGAMDRASSGTVHIAGQDVATLSDTEMTLLRRQKIGFIFQFFNLVPTLTLFENVELPLILNGIDDSEEKVESRLDQLGLARRAGHYPWQLSGGEMQRTSIARALVHEPAIVIADEPTGNLDSISGRNVLEALQRISEENAIPVLMATHSEEAARIAKRRLEVSDGEIVKRES